MNVSLERLQSLCDTLPDLAALRAWIIEQQTEERAKNLLAGKEIALSIPCRRRNADKEMEEYRKEVQGRPVGQFFALHNYGPENYGGKGPKVLTHRASGLSVIGKFTAPAAAVLALVEALEALDIDWSQESPIKGGDAARQAGELCREFTKKHAKK